MSWLIIFLIIIYLVFGWVFSLWFFHLFMNSRWANGDRVTVFDCIVVNLMWPLMLLVILFAYLIQVVFSGGIQKVLRKLYLFD